MNILFISPNLIAGDLARKLALEGHNVKLCIDNKESANNFDHIVPKISDWKGELGWVGKDGLIVFDDVGYGKQQDDLRKKGYKVFGGSALGDKLEKNREFGQQVFGECGMNTVALKDFDNMVDAIEFIKLNPDQWVIKQNNGKKNLNYIGHFKDGRDTISVIKNYLTNKKINKEKITLQKRIHGVEVGVGRYFNGTDWVGPIEINFEHTNFFSGNIGPTVSEMGTLAWYDDNENNILFNKTLAKIKNFLIKANFRGDAEINFIVNENGIFPLEATMRFGSPIIHLQTEIHESPWGEFLYAVATGQKYDLKWKKGYGIVNMIAIPPFPYAKKIKENLSFGLNIYFDECSELDMKHIHFEEVSKRLGSNTYYISDHQGYLLYVTGLSDTVSEAREKVLKIIDKIVIPKAFYRNDIGKKFEEEQITLLRKWGYLS